MTIHKGFVRLVVAAVLLAASVCSTWSGASAAEDKTVRFHMPGYFANLLPYMVSQDQGFFADEGIVVETKILNAGTGVQAMIAGDIDATVIIGLTMRGAITHGAKAKVVFLYNKRPMYSLFVGPGITGYADLKGKRIGSTSPGASASKMLQVNLAAHGLDPKRDVTISYIGSIPTMFQALKNGALDGAVFVTPFDIFARRAKITEIEGFSDVPGALMGGIAVSDRFRNERPEVFKKLMRGSLRGVYYFNTHKAETIPTIVKYMKVDEAMANEIYDAARAAMSETGYATREIQQKALVYDYGKADEAMRVKAFDFSVVEAASKDLGGK